MAGQQFDTILVNLCYLASDFEAAFNLFKKDSSYLKKQYCFIDSTGILEQNDLYKNNSFKIYSYDKDCSDRKRSISRFVDYTSKVSDHRFNNGLHVRDIKIDDFSVYWMTDISEKHPLHHILFNVFYFEEIFNKVHEETKCRDVVFLLPPDRFFYKESLRKYFSSKFEKNTFHSVSGGTYLPTTREKMSFIKQSFSEHALFLKEFKGKEFQIEKKADHKNIFLTYLGSTWIANKKLDFVLNGIKSIDSEHSIYIPIIYDWKNVGDWNVDWDETYLKAMPGKWQWLKFLIKYYYSIKEVNQIPVDNELINEGPVSSYALKMELLLALEYKFFMLKNYQWLKSYLKKSNATNIIYQDEYYSFGRLVSFAITQSKKARSVGFQHGVIREDHTVYALTDVELNGNNPMPSPKTFVVWGKYFQDLVCKRAQSIRNRIVIAANPNLFKSEGIQLIDNNKSLTHEFDLLWCTGLKTELAEELELLLSYLKVRKNVKLRVRMHPIHDLSKEIKAGFNNIGFSEYTFSNEAELVKDIVKAKIILASSASTVVIEALALNRKVIGFTFGKYIPIEMKNSNYSFVRSSQDLLKALEQDSKQIPQELGEDEEILSRDVSKWQLILN